MRLREITSHDALVEVSGGSAFVRYDIPSPLGETAWAVGAAIGLPRLTHRRRRVLLVMGPLADVDQLLGALLARGHLDDLHAVTVQRASLPAVARLLPLGDGNEWEWLCTSTAPAMVEGEARLAALGPDDLPGIAALLALANPRTDAQPFEAPHQQWVGVREGRGGGLLACGVREPSVAGWPTLSGITVHPDARGTGLGLAVTAYLTRSAVLDAGICTLGMYSDNAVARRVYTGLGYGDVHEWSSRRLTG